MSEGEDADGSTVPGAVENRDKPNSKIVEMERKKGLIHTFINKRLSLKQTAAAAVAVAAATIGGYVGVVRARNAIGDNDPNIPILPSSDTSQTIDEHPTIDVTTIPGTNIPTELTPTPTAPAPTPTETPIPAATEQPITPEANNPVYSKVRLRVEAGSLTAEEKEQLLGIVDKLEKTADVLGRFEKAYEVAKEPDGTPTLYKVQTARYGDIDFSSVYPGLTQEQAVKKFWESNLKPAFLGDVANMHGIENALGGAKTFEEFRALLENYGKIYIGAFSVDYTKFEFSPAEPRNLLIDVDADVLANPQTSSKLDAEKAKLADLVAKLPNVGTVHYKIRSKPGGNYDVNTNVIEISLGEQEFPDYIKVHETGHYLDVFLNREMQSILSPESIVKAMILREEIVNLFHSALSVDNYLSTDRIAVSQKMERGEQLSDKELALALNINAERRFLMDAGKLFYHEAGGNDAFFGGRITYSGWAEVIIRQGAELDRLAGQNSNMKDLIADIKARPEYYDRSLGEGPKQGFAFTNEIEALATIRYVLDIYSGKVTIDNNPELKTFLIREADQEIFADFLGTLLKYGDVDSNGTLAGQYLNTLE